MARLGSALTTALVLVFGLLTLLGLLASSGLGLVSDLVNATPLAAAAELFIRLASVTLGLTVLLGILNLLGVHLLRITRRQRAWPYSLVLLASTLLVLVLAALERLGVVTGDPAPTDILLRSVQIAIESALAGLVLFALVFGAARLMRRRVTGSALLFTLVLLALLIAALPLAVPGWGVLGIIRDWLLNVPVSAGVRGILLGIALATAVAGVRVLIGQDRSYRD